MVLFLCPLRVLLFPLKFRPQLANPLTKEEVPDDGCYTANHHEYREIPQSVIAETSTATKDDNDTRNGIFDRFLRQLLGVSFGATACGWKERPT